MLVDSNSRNLLGYQSLEMDDEDKIAYQYNCVQWICCAPIFDSICCFSAKKEHLASEYNKKGKNYYTNGQYDKALKLYQKSLAISSEISSNHFQAVRSHENMGEAYQAKGDLDNALIQYQNCSSILIHNYGNNSQVLAVNCIYQAKVYQAQGKLTESTEQMEKAISILKNLPPPADG